MPSELHPPCPDSCDLLGELPSLRLNILTLRAILHASHTRNPCMLLAHHTELQTHVRSQILDRRKLTATELVDGHHAPARK